MNAIETIQKKPEKQLNGYQLTLIDQARLFNRTLDAFIPLAPETLDTFLSHEAEALGLKVDALIGLIERNIFLASKRGAAEEMFAQAEELHHNHQVVHQHFEEICRLAILGDQAISAQVQVLELLINNLPPTGMIQLFNSLYTSYLNQESFLPYWREAFIMCGFSEEDLHIIRQPSEVTVTEQALIPRTNVHSLEQKVNAINCFIDQLPILVRHSLENLGKSHLDNDKIYAKVRLLCKMMPCFKELEAQIQENPSNETLTERINLLVEMTLCICAFETNKAENLTCTSASATDNIVDTRLLQTSSSANMLKALSPVKPSGSPEHKPLKLAVQGQVVKALLKNVSPINVGVMFKEQLLADPNSRMWQESNQMLLGIKLGLKNSFDWFFGSSDTACDEFHSDTRRVEGPEYTHADAIGLSIEDGVIAEGAASLVVQYREHDAPHMTSGNSSPLAY